MTNFPKEAKDEGNAAAQMEFLEGLECNLDDVRPELQSPTKTLKSPHKDHAGGKGSQKNASKLNSYAQLNSRNVINYAPAK